MVSDLMAALGGIDRSRYPDLHAYADDADASLWALHVVADSGVRPSLSAAQVSDVLRQFGRDVSRQRVAAVLGGSRGLVAINRSSRGAVFTIMRKGSDRVLSSGGGVLVVEPAASFTALQAVDRIMSSLKGEVLICDPYVDDKTLLHIASVPRECRIKVLTLNISDPPKFRSRLVAYLREYANLEFRTDAAGDLHDRYLIDDDTMWYLGQSLNGLGKKQCVIVKQGQDLRSHMLAAFRARWARGTAWS